MEKDHQPKLSPVKAFQVLHGVPGDGEEPYPSLSDFHDYEPNLEFDDSEIQSTCLALWLVEDWRQEYRLSVNRKKTELIKPAQIKPPKLFDTTLTPSTEVKYLGTTFDTAPLPPELLDVHTGEYESPVSDGTIEENFEEQLGPQVWDEQDTDVDGDNIESNDFDTFAELHGKGLVEVGGDDEVGRRIIVVSACHLPSNDQIHSDRLLRYLMFTLDKFVEQDYSVVYFHYGLTSKNKPSYSWLWKAYKTFDRKYKKNLKALYLVHPTKVLRIMLHVLKPALSIKFGPKIKTLNYLHELGEFLNLEQIAIPQAVKDHDRQLLLNNPRAAESSSSHNPSFDPNRNEKGLSPPITQQFGVTLQFIKENNKSMEDAIPPIVKQCVEFLSQPDALETEGIFRRAGNITVIKEIQAQCNKGEAISFKGDPHIAAVLLKNFLKDLKEPLMTFDLYDEICEFQSWARDEAPRRVKILILEKLPLDNYKLLKYIVQFLWKVMDRCDLNKMTSTNLAVVFGPNLVWPPNGQMSLGSIGPINAFTDFVLQNQETIFII